MLRILFQIGRAPYALDSREVVEIVPAVHFRALPKAPDYVCGVFMFRGKVVPVVDLSVLAGFPPCRLLMSTRVMMVEYPDAAGRKRLLGLLAEKVTDTLKRESAKTDPSGVRVPEAPWLGGLVEAEGALIQEVQVQSLLPEKVRDVLFCEEDPVW
ncbi:MAG: chemotaxis protein CheW [Lentisphaerota bacterium]